LIHALIHQLYSFILVGVGMIFRLGEQKLVKNDPRQSNLKYNFMRYLFFEIKIYTVYMCVQWVWGKAPKSWKFSRIFSVI